MGHDSGISAREKWGYGFGDLGMQFVFGLIASVLQKYYTDVLQIPIAMIMMLFIVARVWDAVNDPMWGTFVDTRPVHTKGRYRRWILYVSLPLAIATVLMFVKIPGLSTTGYFIYACVTYIAFGMIYTGMNVPYGSLASVMTADDGERGSLSVFRSVGSAVGTVPAMLLIMLCYTKVGGVKVMSYQRILIGVILIAVAQMGITLLCYAWTKERIVSEAKEKAKSGATRSAVFRLLKSRPFLVLSAAAMLFLAASVFSQSYYTYLADKYFDMPSLSMLAMVCQYLPVAAIMGFVGKLNRRFGRKDLCAIGMLECGLVYLVLFFLQTSNPWIFLSFCLVAGIGNAFMFLQVWALATEVIDYNEQVLGIEERAISYSFFSFIRKLGHAVAAIFVNASLMQIGYSTEAISIESLQGMYNSSVLIPALLYLIAFALLMFFYPLHGGKKVDWYATSPPGNNEDIIT